MAWYYGTFSCGCEGRVNIIGPSKDRDWKKQRAFSKECDKCYREKLEKARELDNKRALELAKEMELPKLEGTEKQVAWANTIRQSLIDKVASFIGKGDLGSFDNEAKQRIKDINNMSVVLDYVIDKKVSAEFWINNRESIKWDNIEFIFKDYIKDALPTDEEVQKKITQQDIELESIISPKEVIKPGVVEINLVDNTVELVYQKDNDFIECVRSLGYRWKGKWRKNITELTGSYKDRMAEIGNLLLNEGFSIRIYNSEIRRKAISGQFEREQERWIIFNIEEDKLWIKWEYGNNKLYNTVKKLPGSKYKDGKMLIDIANYEVIKEFAELYNFKFTKKADEKIKCYIEKMKNVTVVNPLQIEDKGLEEEGLESILNSSREILDDLLDS